MDIAQIELPYQIYIVRDSVDKSPNMMANFDARRVQYKFPNGWGASVTMGSLFYTDEHHHFEMCPMKGGSLWYDAIDSDNQDVYGYLDEGELYILLTKLLVKEQCNE